MTIVFIFVQTWAVLKSRRPLRTLPAAALAAVLALGGLTGCGSGAAGGSGGPEIVASFYPVAWLAENVAGPDARVRTLTRPGTEPHDLELTARQVADVGRADLVIYVRGVQPAVDDAVRKHAKGTALDAASVVPTIPAPTGDDGHEHEHGHEGEEGHGHEKGGDRDPHVWLDPGRMAAIAARFGERLAATDPARAAAHRSRAAALAARLNALDQAFQDGLKSCERRTIVTAHAAFGYLAHRYGLTQVSIAGVDASAEPSPGRLAELTRRVRATGATTVFTETLVSPKVAESLARAAGVRTAVLDPAEGVRQGSSDDYLSIMRRNLDTLKPALGCR